MSNFSYTSSNAAIFTVSNTGLVTGNTTGSATLIVNDITNGVSGSDVVYVVSAISTSLSPSTPTVVSGANQIFLIKDQYSNILTGGTFTSSDPTHAPIGSTSGITTPSLAGNYTITGLYFNGYTTLSASTVMTVVSGSPVIINLSGVSATSNIRNVMVVTVITGLSVVINLTGVSATSSIGSVTPILGAVVVTPGSILASPGAYPVQFVVTNNGTVVTSDPGTSYSSGNTSVVTMDLTAPTLNSITGNVDQGDSAVSHPIIGTGLVTGQTLLGLPSGVTAASIVASSGTAATVAISATGAATIGTYTSVYLHDPTTLLNSNTTSIVVAASGSSPKTYIDSQALYSAGGAVPLNSKSLTVAAGDLIVVYVRAANNSSGYNVFSVGDSKNTYSLVGTLFDDGVHAMALYAAKNCVAGATVVTGSNGNLPFFGMAVAQYRGCDPVSPVDVYTGIQVNAATVTSPAFTTTNAYEAIVVGVLGDATTTLALTSPFTMRAQAGDVVGIGDNIVSTIQTGITATATCTGASHLGIIIGSFK